VRPASVFSPFGRLLAGLRRAFGRARSFCLGLFLGDVALGLRLVLLGASLLAEPVMANHDANNFLGFAYHAFDDASDGFDPSAVVLTHD
jgi:hypothetical protein